MKFFLESTSSKRHVVFLMSVGCVQVKTTAKRVIWRQDFGLKYNFGENM